MERNDREKSTGSRARAILGFILVLAFSAWLVKHYFGFSSADPPVSGIPAGAMTGWYIDLADDTPADKISEIASAAGAILTPNSEFSESSRIYLVDSAPGAPSADATAEGGKAGFLGRLASLFRSRDAQVESWGPNLILSLPGSPDGQGIWTRAFPASPGASRTSGQGDESAMGFPNDPYYKYQWHLRDVGSDKVWPKHRGAKVVVAVIDTGVAYTDHKNVKKVEDLDGTAFVKGFDFVDRDGVPVDENGHGTHVAGTIAQATNNGKGVAGLAYGASIMPIRVLDKNGSGSLVNVAEGIRWAADHGAKVLNLSLGSPYSAKLLEDACKYAKAKGCLVVCAAGNSNTDRKFYPAGYDSTMAVASLDSRGRRAFYSNYGKWIQICAPGGDIRHDYNGDGQPDGVLQCTIDPQSPGNSIYAQYMGTSMASPHVAAVAAVLIGSGRVPAKRVEAVLRETARPVKDEGMGAGCVDASRALDATGYDRDLRRFFISIAIMALVFFRSGLASLRRVFWRPSFITALIITISGLSVARIFGFPFGGISDIFFMSLVEWLESIIDSDLAYNPLVYSFIVPMVYSLIVMGWDSGKRSALAFCIGYATILFDSAIFGHGDVSFIPGVSILDTLWLLGNSGILMVFARLMASPDQDEIFFGQTRE